MSPQQKIIAIAGGSAAAVIVIGFTFFLWRRKQQEGASSKNNNKYISKDDEQQQHSVENIASAGQSIVEVRVPPRVVGTIIGHNGTNIKQLRREFGVRFDFEREDNLNIDISQKNDRVLVIRGEREKVYAAKQRIKGIISEAPTHVDNEMFVPQETLGRIIGKGGNTIRELSNISGAKITVDRDENPALGELRRIKLSGTLLQVEYAKALVGEKVELEKSFRIKKENQTPERPTPNVKSISNVKIPDKNEYFEIFVSAVESPNHIFAQLVNQDSVKLTAIDKEMAETYGKLESNEERLESGKVGDLCVAPYSNEGWYRGAITSIDVTKRSAQIFFVDYGDTVSVNIDQLKNIRTELLLLPAHAIECYLPINIKQESNKTLEQVKEMTKCAQWIPLMAKCVGYKELHEKKFPILDLIDTKNKDLNVCDELVKKGIVSWNENDCMIKLVKEQKSNENISRDKNRTLIMERKKQDSFEDFIDIDVEDVNGSLSAVLTQRQYEAEEPIAQVQTEHDLSSHDSTLVDDSTLYDEEIQREKEDEKPATPGNDENELQRSLEETSRKNVRMNSMELARENLMLISGEYVSQDDSDSFVSARSDVTITDGDQTDNMSFVTATDRLTPANDISFSIPDLTKTSSPRGSIISIPPKTSSQHGSSNDLTRPIGANTKRLSGSKFEIQFIDETTHKVMSRESLNTNFEASAIIKDKKIGKETTV